VHAFKKNSIHEIHFEIAEHEGKRYVDVRTWALNPSGEYVPTKSPGGVNFPAEFWPKFAHGVELLAAALEGDGAKGNGDD
jgi:hypothetical protein